MIIAHRDQIDGREQSLVNHLINVGTRCYEDGKKVGLENTCYLAGILHDLGKADPAFQKMIKDNTTDKVNHSSAGAKYLLYISGLLIKSDSSFDNALFKSYLEILSIVITAHHGLYDIGDINIKFDNGLINRLQYDESIDKYDFNTVIEFGDELNTHSLKMRGLELTDYISLGFNEYIAINEKMDVHFESGSTVEFNYYNHCLMRLILSILKNNDIVDTINAYENVVDTNILKSAHVIDDFLQKIEDEYDKYGDPTSDINIVRSDLVKQIRSRCDTDTNGIYKLNIPTGGGKTKLSLLYSLHQMKYTNRYKMIYTAPYLSILEQNAKEIYEILEDKRFILEHHSNVISRDEEKNTETIEDERHTAINEYIIDSWDQTIVLTTMVQFTNTLFRGMSANIRRFYNLSNSVIILDEIQSLPVETTHIINLMLNFIANVMNSIIILCSATQPPYNHENIEYKLKYGGTKDEQVELVKISSEQQEVFKRTNVMLLNNGETSTLLDIYNSIIKLTDKSILVILNTKKAVENMYKLLAENLNKDNLYYLTTNMCPKHRLDIIEEISQKLNNNEAVVCISTSLIEAGVNLDFEVLYRSYAGMDSMIQAMGRCNREGSQPNRGDVYLVNMNEEEENLNNLKSIKYKKEISKYVLKNHREEFEIESFNKYYYDKYYSNANNLNYEISDNKSLMDLLSVNGQYIKAVGTSFTLNNQAFKEASNNFQLINSDTESIIVYYRESAELIERLIETSNEYIKTYQQDQILEIKSILRQLQPYTLNIYNLCSFRDKLINTEGLMYFGINILAEAFYDEKIGLTKKVEIDSFMI